MAKCLTSPKRQCCPPLLQPSPLPRRCAGRRGSSRSLLKPVRSLPAWPCRASLTGTQLWHHAPSRPKSSCSCAPLISLLHHHCSLSSSPLQASVGPGCPRGVCFDQVGFLVSFSRFLVPQATVPRSFRGAHHHDAPLSCCSFGDEGSLHSVPCDRRISLPRARPRRVIRRSS